MQALNHALPGGGEARDREEIGRRE